MRCPKCGGDTEVVEKRGPFRDRRCLRSRCRFGFTTSENFIVQDEDRHVGAKALAKRTAALKPPPAEHAKAASAS
jgi:hypothetical protein